MLVLYISNYICNNRINSIYGEIMSELEKFIFSLMFPDDEDEDGEK